MSEILVKRLDHVTLEVEDEIKARAFYEGLLNLKEVPRPENFSFPGMWYELGNSTLHIVAPRKPVIGSHHIAIWVSDVQGAAKILVAAGCNVKWDNFKIPGVDRFFTQDPEGNRIEVQGKDSA